ncbi:MAG TPA: transketolase [Anaerolineaceae bacterium]|nr:transketolase [Anaerolineaceae bacterium]
MKNNRKPAGASQSEIDNLCINLIRFLSIDAIQKANSGHPGMPMGAAPMAYILWTRFLKHNPANPDWFDRDRFVLSAGHGSMLLYSLLYLTGYDLSLEQIKRFRQWESLTPGHPERGLAPGVETTTGPLGQGFANGVGLAIAESFLAARFNRPGFALVDHYTYGIASDGDLMEGVAAEAASLAGHLKLGKLIYFYDNNHVTLSAATGLTFTEDVRKRFEAYGWHTQVVNDGNDLQHILRALKSAHRVNDRPSLILIQTHLGYGSPNKQDTFEAHGSPLGPEEVRLTKEKLGWPLSPDFYIPDQALKHFRQARHRGQQLEARWNSVFAKYSDLYPELAEELSMMIEGKLVESWDKNIPSFIPDPKGMATRSAIQKIMNASATSLPNLIGGSADLDPSTRTMLSGLGDFENPDSKPGDTQGAASGEWSYAGRNIHFGIREHAMGAILNGMAVHGGLIPYGATFLIFSDYMRPPMRLAALMKAHVIYVFTHDSIALGEDGPTHQPVEQLLGIRSIPGMLVIRPADANETAAAWKVAVESNNGPVALVLSRQNLPVLDLAKYPQIPLGVKAGGYVLVHSVVEEAPDIVLVATGSEVSLALSAREKLDLEGIKARVVSLPSWNLFARQPQEYRQSVIPPEIPFLAIEAGLPLGWQAYFGPSNPVIGVNRFGASAPGEIVMREYGLNVENVCAQARLILRQERQRSL